MGLTQTIVIEDDQRIYLVAPVSPIEPSAQEIEEYAYGPSIVDAAARQAPNPFIKWYGGHYVEADNANGNGAMWTAKEIALKSATPMYMPVTVMHDPTTAVGLIADVALRTPEKDQVARPKLETALALWAHRFPQVIEEAQVNYEAGTLMQSMECLAPAYDCGVCGLGYLKLPGGAERANWCSHLKGEEGAQAVRILRATTFTGTGLIFGTRGASGADPLAHLDDFKQEVAEFHQRGTSQVDKRPSPRSKRTMETLEISKAEYDALQARPTADQIETAQDERDRAVRAQEESDAENVRLKARIETQDGEIADFKEQANQGALRTERMGKLGDKFVAALGERTRTRLTDQAAKMEDADWADRIAELAELVKIPVDAQLDPNAPSVIPGVAPSGTPVFTAEEVARQQITGTESVLTIPAKVTRGVIAGLVNRPKAAK